MNSDNRAHNGSVLCLDLNSDNTLLASGSLDSTVNIINVHNCKVLLTIKAGGGGARQSNKSEELKTDEEDGNDSIESVTFSGKNLLALATVNGVLETWDVSSQTKRNELKLDFGICKISTDSNNPNLLYCGCLDSVFRVVDWRNCEVVLSRAGHTDQILDYAVSSDSNYVLTCSEDATCKIFALKNN